MKFSYQFLLSYFSALVRCNHMEWMMQFSFFSCRLRLWSMKKRDENERKLIVNDIFCSFFLLVGVVKSSPSFYVHAVHIENEIKFECIRMACWRLVWFFLKSTWITTINLLLTTHQPRVDDIYYVFSSSRLIQCQKTIINCRWVAWVCMTSN